MLMMTLIRSWATKRRIGCLVDWTIKTRQLIGFNQLIQLLVILRIRSIATL